MSVRQAVGGPQAGGSAEKQPTFVYERRVAERGSSVVSTHVTRSPSGEVALAEEGTHSPDYDRSRPWS